MKGWKSKVLYKKKQPNNRNKIVLLFNMCEESSLECQLNNQGYTLSENAIVFQERLEKIHDDYMKNKISDKYKSRLYNRLHNSILKNVELRTGVN